MSKPATHSPQGELSKSFSGHAPADKPMESTLAVPKDSAAKSHSSSNASGPANATAGSQSSTEHTSARTTPATAASSGASKGNGKSPADAESIAQKLHSYLNQTGLFAAELASLKESQLSLKRTRLPN